MISEKVLDIALRNTPITDSEWKGLLEERQKLIRPRLKQVANAKLGHTLYTSPGLSFTLFKFVEELKVCEGIEHLQARGVFGIARSRDKPRDERCLHFFGLTSDEIWMNGKLVIDGNERGCVQVWPMVIPEYFEGFNLSYRRLFNLLGTAVEKWMRQRERRFKEAQELHRRFAIERELFDHIWSAHEKD